MTMFFIDRTAMQMYGIGMGPGGRPRASRGPSVIDLRQPAQTSTGSAIEAVTALPDRPATEEEVRTAVASAQRVAPGIESSIAESFLAARMTMVQVNADLFGVVTAAAAEAEEIAKRIVADFRGRTANQNAE